MGRFKRGCYERERKRDNDGSVTEKRRIRFLSTIFAFGLLPVSCFQMKKRKNFFCFFLIDLYSFLPQFAFKFKINLKSQFENKFYAKETK